MGETEKSPADRKFKSRRENYWEPFYRGKSVTPAFTWEIYDSKHSAGPKSCFLTIESFGVNRIFEDVHFIDCDFRGSFGRGFFVFKACRFESCDFGLSSWRTAKFTKCEFSATSFSQSSFTNSTFRDCKWKNIYFSSTKINGIIINNPRSFVEAASTNLDRHFLAEFGKTPVEQKAALELTKATMARAILANLAKEGDEASYYDAVHVYYAQTYKERIESAKQKIISGKVLMKVYALVQMANAYAERFLIEIAGNINNWGASLSRPLWFGICIFLAFASLYRHLGVFHNWSYALMASADITLVAGYTKQSSAITCLRDQNLFLINLLFGLAWYGILVPTVINRISRVR